MHHAEQNAIAAETHRFRDDRPALPNLNSVEKQNLVAEYLDSLKDDRETVLGLCESLFADPDFARNLIDAALHDDVQVLDQKWILAALADKAVEDYLEAAEEWDAERAYLEVDA